MKKTLIALAALVCSVAQAATISSTVTMDEILASATNNGATVSSAWESSNGSVYDLSTGNFSGSTNETVLDLLNNRSDSTFITIAAWINPSTLSGDQMIFGWGGQANGIQFGLNGSSLKYTTKGVSDFTGGTAAQVGEWSMVALTFSTNSGRLYANTGDYWTRNPGNTNSVGETENSFAIGNGNYDGNRSGSYTGLLSNFTILASDGLLTNAQIAEAIGTVPTAVQAPATPEPATATLSLLALAALAARRRRK